MFEQTAHQRDSSYNEQATRWSRQAIGKAEIVRPLVDLHPVPSDVMAEACARAARLLSKERVPPQTIYNWVKAFRAGGIGGLEHKPHRDRGASTLHPDLCQYIEDLLKSDKNYKLAEVHRRAVQKAQEMDLDEEQYPTYDQVRFVDGRLSAAVKKYGREGRRAYRATNELVGRFEAEYPNDIWQCDHHLLDILIINEETGRPERPWITAIIDDYSRVIMGFYLSFADPNSNSIALALHHAMWPKPHELWVMHGVPRVLYVDNGKDFRSRHIEEVCLHFQIECRPHEPYLARSKGKIERWFRTLEEMLIAYLDGYVGSNTKKRPAKITPKLTLDQLRDCIVDFIVKTYHERIHSQTKAKPRMRWSEVPTVIRSVTQPEDLDYLLEPTSRIVQNDGIQFRNARYVDKDGKLTAYIGKTVRIFFNRNDTSSIRVYCRDADKERYLCTAYPNVAPHLIAEQNKAIRQELSREVQARKQRLQSDSRKNEVGSPAASAQPAKHIWPPQPASTRPPIRRFRYELEETDDDDTNAAG